MALIDGNEMRSLANNMAILDFALSSGNAVDRNLKRMEMEFGGYVYQFAVNPESYKLKEPARFNITQTKTGAYAEAFGPGIREITISGVTGFRNGTSNPEMGYRKFKEMRNIIRTMFMMNTDGKPIDKYLNFYNFTDNDYFVCYPDTFDLDRSKNNPFLYRYNIHLWVIKIMGEADTDEFGQIRGGIGSPLNAMFVANTILSGGINKSTMTNAVVNTAVSTVSKVAGKGSNEELIAKTVGQIALQGWKW